MSFEDIAISIHALRGEGDGYACISVTCFERNFNPRPPWGGRRYRRVRFRLYRRISIHALRGEGDGMHPAKRYAQVISIHALRGEGDSFKLRLKVGAKFQSTPSVGRATVNARRTVDIGRHFNPRPPWGGRLSVSQPVSSTSHFNPRPPWGGRHILGIVCYDIDNISIHALRGEGDEVEPRLCRFLRHFNPRPPWGGRQQKHTNIQHCVCT